MGSGVFDANGILRVGPNIDGASFWEVTGDIDDTAVSYSASVGQFVVVGALAGPLAIALPGDTDLPNLNAAPVPGDMVAVKLMGDPDGNTVTVGCDPLGIDGSNNVALTTQYQQLFVVFVSNAEGWAILESGEGVAEVFSVFAATGNILPGWAVSDTNTLTGAPLAGGFDALVLKDNTGAHTVLAAGDDTGGAVLLSLDGTNSVTVNNTATTVAGPLTNTTGPATFPEIISTQASAPADGTLAASQVTFWIDATNGAGVFHIKGKTVDGTVVGAAIPLT